jgi:hypothetical protein
LIETRLNELAANVVLPHRNASWPKKENEQRHEKRKHSDQLKQLCSRGFRVVGDMTITSIRRKTSNKISRQQRAFRIMLDLVVAVLAIALLLTPAEGRICNATDSSDLPFTTGCDFCNETITSGFNGCYNNGTCYRQVSDSSLVTRGPFFFHTRWPVADLVAPQGAWFAWSIEGLRLHVTANEGI